MALTIDDLARLDRAARKRVDDVWSRVHENVMRPQVERDELSEYQALTSGEHGMLYQQVGPDQYQQYVDEMERLRQKHMAGG